MDSLKAIVFALPLVLLIFTSVKCSPDKKETDQNLDVQADDASPKVGEEDYIEEIDASPQGGYASHGNFYDFKVKDAEGKDVDLSKYKGQVFIKQFYSS